MAIYLSNLYHKFFLEFFRFPYALPCISISFFSVVALLVFFWLPVSCKNRTECNIFSLWMLCGKKERKKRLLFLCLRDYCCISFIFLHNWILQMLNGANNIMECILFWSTYMDVHWSKEKKVFPTNWRINGDCQICLIAQILMTWMFTVLFIESGDRTQPCMLLWFLAKFCISLRTIATQMEKKRITWLKYLKKKM